MRPIITKGELTFRSGGRSLHAPNRAVRRHCCASDPWRVAPSVRSNLVFGSDTLVKTVVRSPTPAARSFRADVRRFGRLINKDGVLGTHSLAVAGRAVAIGGLPEAFFSDFAPSVGFSNLDFYFTARSAEEVLITDESLIILLSRECSSLTPSHALACLMDGLRFRSRERTHVPTQRKTRAVH